MKKNLFLIKLICSLIFINVLSVFAFGEANGSDNLAYPKEIAEWSEAIKAEQRIAGEEMIGALKNAIEAGLNEYKIDPGNYRLSKSFLASPVIFENAKDIEIIADSATIWIEKPDGLVFQIMNSVNVKITGLTIDYDPLPFTQGTILELLPSENALIMNIDNGFSSPMEDQIYAATTKYSSRVFIFNPLGEMRENIRDDWVKDFEDLGDGKYKLILKGGYNYLPDYAKYQPYKTGDKIVIPVRSGALFSVTKSESVKFENCNIYTSCGMGFICTYGKGKHEFNNVNIIPRPNTGRLLSAVADGIHSYNSEIGPDIRNCRIENLGDDAINLHGFFGIAFQNPVSSKVIEITNPFEYNYHEGMKLELFDYESLQWIDSLRIESVEIISGSVAETRIENLRSTFETEGKRIRSFQWKSIYRITLNKPIALQSEALVVNEDYVSGGFKVINNNIQNIVSRGILTKSANGIIGGNTTNHTGYSGILLYSEASYWLEGPFNKNITVENNKVENSCISLNARLQPNENGAIALDVDKDIDFGGKYLCENISILNNHVKTSGTSGISLNASRNITIQNNLVENAVSLEPFKNNRNNGIFIGCCTEYQLEDNTVTDTSSWMLDPVAISSCAVSLRPINSETKKGLLYPNPSDDVFSAQLPNRNFSLAIYDLSGRIVFRKEDNYDLVKIDSVGFPSGFYSVLFALDNNTWQREKLIICHN